MKDHDFPLALAFLESQAKSAAGVLASMASPESGAFLNSVPASLAAGVLAKMSASDATSILAEMSPLAAASALTELDDRDAVAMLRLMAPPIRQPVLTALPQKLRRDFEKLISHPPNLVGAKMTTGIAMIDWEDTVKDARERLRRFPDDGLDVVYVVDGERRLKGYLSAFDLLRYPSERRLSDVRVRRVNPILSHASLSSIAESQYWESQKALPVINRQRQLIGALFKADLTGSPELETGSNLKQDDSSIVLALVGGFVACFVALADLLADLQTGPTSQNN